MQNIILQKYFFVCKVDKSCEQCAYLLNTGFAGFARDRAEDKGLWIQDRGPRTQDPGPRTQPVTQDLQQDRISRSKDRTEDCGSRTLDESKSWFTKNFHSMNLDSYFKLRYNYGILRLTGVA